MSVKAWSLKIGELKSLKRDGLLLLAARCAMRVEAWRPPEGREACTRGVAYVVKAAFAPPTRHDRALFREISDAGAKVCNRLEATDSPFGQCVNYSTNTLSAGVAATAAVELPKLKKEVMDCAKLSASIAAVLAHAGRAPAPRGKDPVEVAAGAIWAAIRADIPVLAARASEVEAASDPVAALRELAPLWPAGTPTWVPVERAAP